MERRDVIWEILSDTYEDGDRSKDRLAYYVATDMDNRWVKMEDRANQYRGGIFREVANMIWLNYSGGGTAANTAAKILTRLGIDFKRDDQ